MNPIQGFAALAILGAVGGAIAAGKTMLPAERHQGGIAYVTGGIGQQEAKVFKHAAGRFPLALEFVQRAGKRDHFIAGVQVKLTDRHGKTVLSTKADGPFLLARIPSGRYTVAATYDGKALKRPVVVQPKAKHPIVLEWKQGA
jgi:hypothetical protein